MAIRISINNKPITELFGDKNGKVREHIATLSVKASDTLAYAELRRAVDDLEDEIMLQMCALGELVYATHCGTPSDSDELQKILEYIDDLHDEIEGHEQQMKFLRGIRSCPICGGEVSDSDMYCQDCGQPLPVTNSQLS